jgi:2-polyprenyl-3-methyl-5-hydroxy-6-metoxy-1,4-benzoquinol methylase
MQQFLVIGTLNVFMENIDDVKRSQTGVLKYKLTNANVYVSPGGYTYIDYLDSVEGISPDMDESELSNQEIEYLEKELQSNAERFENQINIVNNYVPINTSKALDIGCGGGLFLSKLEKEGAEVFGIELSGSRACYASKKHKLNVIKRPIESDYWQDSYVNAFDIVTLWDVIEHVNYPSQTLQSASNVLKNGGVLFVDTPCKDSFYHRVGNLTYWLSNGRFPTFLNIMYSAHKFGHKQIFSTAEMRALFEKAGLEVLEIRKFHELSFPYGFYLKKMFRSDALVKVLEPLVNMSLFIFPVRNKMLVIGRKSVGSGD